MENPTAFLKSIRIIGTLAGIFLLGIIMNCGNNRDMTMNIEELFPKESSGWMIEDTLETYDYDGIFKYIDGAGEVYRMYAYREVLVAHYAKESAPNLTAEIFDMSKPEDAFGIFMHSTSGTDSGIGQGSEQVGGVLYFWKNRYFISVYADSRTPESDHAVMTIAQAIALAITEKGTKPKLIEYLPEAGNPPAEIKYFHLHTSLNYYYYLSPENILNLNKDTEAVLAGYAPDDSYLVIIAYPDNKAAGEARKSFIDSYIPEAGDEGIYEIEDENWTAIKQKGSFLIIVFEAADRESARNMIQAVIDILP
jgi:hypothetical protein